MKPDATRRQHVIERVSYATETIECSCYAIVQAEPDTFEHDKHGPLVTAWERHRREAGLTKGSGIRGTGWRGEWSVK